MDATMRVIEREGVAAVSQRRVAAEAGVPPSAVTYHYASIDDLLVATLTRVNDSYVTALEALSDDRDEALRGLAGIIARRGSGRAHLMAECELFLMAARRPALRPEVDRWNRAVDAFLAPRLADPADRAGVAAAIDGLFLRGCVEDPPPGVEEVHRIIVRLVPGRRNGPAGPR
ncbi:TetR family transcriptional regulator [Nocardiopsis sp. N85]|uniref:TetR/AcrR family transcriptional regulator n=1 Tax=Nocardiopsis sp. N85 TaxID=3029400 RepID=UPI00237FCE08|nr:TetR family transcriptional regulator [Nocardiopsis sp. N85]MDE3724891.1 TetR family transcriptional regulator [Nocardiopsis sp. N85]